MGDISAFPDDLKLKLQEMVDSTAGNTRCTLNLCVNYGGRADIVQAVNTIVNSAKSGEQSTEITEQSFAKYLYGSYIPNPDFVVRTSGEKRISNFMLYQMAYAELHFIKIFWPDINNKWVDKCIIEFQKRNRRYGKV